MVLGWDEIDDSLPETRLQGTKHGPGGTEAGWVF
jgi:hypothetical protein